MKIRTSTKIFIIALVFYVITSACYLVAKTIYNKELEELKKSVFYSSISLHLKPDLNNWHYVSLASFCIAVAITVAGIWLRKIK
jgi:hypothetical protein